MSHLAADRARALAAGADATDAEAAHLFACPACAAACEPRGVALPLATLRAASFDLGPARLRVVEESLLERVRARRSRRRGVLAAVPLVALAAAAAWAFFPRPHAVAPSPVSHAQVDVEPGGRVTADQSGSDELVSLEGRATFSVGKLAPGDRYRVRVRGDEVEVRGTRFSIDADADGIRGVVVSEGVVEVRPACCAPARLAAGERWLRPIVEAPPPAAESAPLPQPPASASPSAAGNATPDVPAAELLARGTAAYDAGSYSAAAELLRRAVRAEPGAAWARDATVLAGAASVMLAAPDAIPSMSASVASLDAAAKRAQRGGDAKRAAMAQIAAARRSAGPAKLSRYCALAGSSALSPALRDEASRACSPK